MYTAVKRDILTDLKYFIWKLLFTRVTCSSAPQRLTSANPYLRAELWIKVQRQGWLCWGKNNVQKGQSVKKYWRTVGVCVPIKPLYEAGCEYSFGCQTDLKSSLLGSVISSVLLGDEQSYLSLFPASYWKCAHFWETDFRKYGTLPVTPSLKSQKCWECTTFCIS